MTTDHYQDPIAAMTVGQLLGVYAKVLAELRGRGLVRTKNAPIGDLAEYCAAVVYDGVLAPNSAKSYDLTAQDGRRVQVKVRQLPSSRSAVFSPIRTFDFDLCVFLLIDDDHTVAIAREWTPDQVRRHGSHRAHTNDTVVRVGQLSAAGVDRTADFAEAWSWLMEMTSPATGTQAFLG